MSSIKTFLEFKPISEIPDTVIQAVLIGGEMVGEISCSYNLAEAWRVEGGPADDWCVGSNCEIRILNPTHWSPIPGVVHNFVLYPADKLEEHLNSMFGAE